MNIFIDFLMKLVILVPIVITVISYVIYSNNKKYKKLLLFTLPNFILSVIIPVLMTLFISYGGNYRYAFETFLNGLANNRIFSWLLLILTVIQISLTCINGVYLVKEEIKPKEKEGKTKKIILKLNKVEKVILISLIVIFLSILITDVYMLENEQKPIFSMYIGGYSDGGTTVYLGFGYKIIDYNKLDGYDGYKIGTWFMQYDNSL